MIFTLLFWGVRRRACRRFSKNAGSDSGFYTRNESARLLETGAARFCFVRLDYILKGCFLRVREFLHTCAKISCQVGYRVASVS